MCKLLYVLNLKYQIPMRNMLSLQRALTVQFCTKMAISQNDQGHGKMKIA